MNSEIADALREILNRLECLTTMVEDHHMRINAFRYAGEDEDTPRPDTMTYPREVITGTIKKLRGVA